MRISSILQVVNRIKHSRSLTTERCNNTNPTNVHFTSEPILPRNDVIWEMDDDNNNEYANDEAKFPSAMEPQWCSNLGNRAKSDSALLLKDTVPAGKRAHPTKKHRDHVPKLSQTVTDAPLIADTGTDFSADIQEIVDIMDSLSLESLNSPDINNALRQVEELCNVDMENDASLNAR